MFRSFRAIERWLERYFEDCAYRLAPELDALSACFSQREPGACALTAVSIGLVHGARTRGSLLTTPDQFCPKDASGRGRPLAGWEKGSNLPDKQD
jgi:hypothetical protein